MTIINAYILWDEHHKDGQELFGVAIISRGNGKRTYKTYSAQNMTKSQAYTVAAQLTPNERDAAMYRQLALDKWEGDWTAAIPI